ncbi:MAG: hypothetical protein DME08_18490 [Candidatus Rokuibacteriota bacterium]|nr:MAG: hypothetical protein DME08_18490 [Candidatus Rokubacteria bacterium]
MRRPPLVVVLIAVFVMALGETAGAVMSQMRPQTERYTLARVAGNPGVHGLTGSAEYDDEVRARAVFAVEAGLSFFHTHAEGLAPVMLVAATLVASLVGSRRIRAALYAAMTLGVLFPLGYLAYAAAVLELGRDDGAAFAERWVLTPLGTLAIVGILGLLVALGTRRAPVT